MKTRNKYKSRDGVWHEDFVVDEGREVRVPLWAADSFRADLVRSFGATDALDVHRPGFRVAGSTTRDSVSSARQEMIDRARSGWRMDKRRPPDDDDDDDEDDLDREVGADRARAIRARRGMIDRAANAWRDAVPQPALVGPGPRAFVEQVGRTGGGSENTGPGPGSTLSSPTAGPAPERPDPNDDQAKRDAAWKSYKDQLSSAWRGMGPAAAGPSLEWTGAGT
jgi:hypothetical protein